MPEDEYDLAGFAVGVVDEKDMITGEDLKDGRCTDRYGIFRCTQQRIFTGKKSISAWMTKNTEHLP